MSSVVNNFQQKLSELTLTPFIYLVAAILFIVLAEMSQDKEVAVFTPSIFSFMFDKDYLHHM